MPRLPVSPYWSANPNFPIFLDPKDDYRVQGQTPPHSRHAPEYICPTCETSSRDTPIHCVSKPPAHSPTPPSYSLLAPPPQSSRHLAVPILTVETPRHRSKPQAPNRSLQFDPKGRPHLRFRRNAFSPHSPTVTESDKIDWRRKSIAGLGIEEAPFRPDTSPITPGIAEKRGEENAADVQQASNFAQRIEQRLWRYSASRNVVKRWLLEIISWTLSAACMAGVIVMLYVYQNRSIPRWPLGLTLNAYISVLAKIASAALLLPVSEALGQLKWSWFQGDNSKKMWDFEIFDNASRGPWGSLLLIIRTKGRSLAALGACVTIMALCLDPFFQQVVEYPEKWRLQDGKGQIPRAIGYEPFYSSMSFQQGFQTMETDQSMVGVGYRFFFGNGTPPMTFGKGMRAEVPLGCPNSNCTWPDYETFGISNECRDAIDRMEFRCSHGPMDWIQMPDADPDAVEDYTFPNGTSCGWWLKADKPLLMTGYNVDRRSNHSGEILLQRAQPLYDLFSREFMPGYTPLLNNSRNPLAHVIIVSGEEAESVHRNATPSAQECILSWSAQTMQSTYTAGGYIEKITRAFVNTSVGESHWLTTVIPNDNNQMILYDYVYLENITLITENNTYFIDNNTHNAMVALFDDVFPSTYTILSDDKDAQPMMRWKWWKTITPYTRRMIYNPWLYRNVTMHMDRMASAMTNMMRSAPSDTETVEGMAYDLESFVDVRWVWLSLPLGLLAFTGIFLLATIFRSSREHDRGQVGVWKTSAIATLLYGLPDDMSKKMTSTKADETPRAKAKEVKVKWVPIGGWRFSGNSIPPSFKGSPSSS
ncbi:uncharacterized protein CC84DRAFT_1210624 [Paraphaeosphaeria sporulosa]|uniref:DUF3176 domain-containing protein n=1 Tax=Paraphaeosphaeria sporulosa TaxID=1460663 RepID=A0A177BU19_9PLEO|nr:uncharacterized protein CC84DRAFT_1210624 [Paraphaeosphaeria sporulosa]OAF98754.1 hypothetical protein CC84DRAFT_1210624 [Paraphaeosphaeria sporulosa]